jgi:hypothetical protein
MPTEMFVAPAGSAGVAQLTCVHVDELGNAFDSFR